MRLFIILVSLLANTLATDDQNTLQLVQVFFRHGARTPEFKDAYPNDPYKADTFRPTGWGQLTNLGKHQAYTLGKVLRKRYNDFLGDIFYPEIVYAQSTDFDRTKASAQLVLAGLFAPSSSQTWNDDLKWQPVSLAYEKTDEDFFLRRPVTYCPVYAKELEDVYASEDYQSYLRANRQDFDFMTAETGRDISNTSGGMAMYQTLTAEKYLNLTLPEWTRKVYPDKITELAVKQCLYENSRPVLRKLNGGRSLQKVLENIIAAKASSEGENKRKIYLYSAHENNVLNVLAALDLYDAHFPFYSSAVVIELHYLESKKEYAVKVLYQRFLDKEIEEKQLEGCDIVCPLERFIEITRPMVPVNYTAECGSNIYLD